MAKSSNDDIITLTTQSGEEVDFIEIAGINYKNKFYAILQPVELLEGMADNEAFVFKVTRVNGNDTFDIELDDKIIDHVFEEYNKLLDKTTGKKLKKSSGVSKVFSATTKVVKKTIWLVKFIIGIAITLVGIVCIIGGIVSRESLGVIGTIVICGIGVIALVIGGRFVAKLWKKRNK